MRKLIIVGNWKMNKIFGEVVSFVEEVKFFILVVDKVEVVVCVLVFFLEKFIFVVKGIDLKVGV